ncbi:MAG: CatB-related O-acetyltransferase [Nitratireductor sp.]
MPSAAPDPSRRYPMPGVDRLVFLQAVVTNPRIEVGRFTYYDDPDGPEGFERNVLYHFDFIGDRLKIGPFCQVAAGATFIMNGGNHAQNGLSTYPFFAFGGEWAGRFEGETDAPLKGDTVIGADVWIGAKAVIMPGLTIGDGAIIGAHAVVTRDVAPYAVAAGNPAEEIRRRFDAATIEALLDLRWWDWPVERITQAIPALGRGDLAALRALAP